MPGLGHGWERGIKMVVGAVIGAVILGEIIPLIVDQGLIPSWLFWLVFPASISSAILIVDASRYWSFGYLAGVVLGIFFALPIFLDAGLLGPLDLLIYGGVAVGSVALRVKIHNSSF